MLYMLMLVSLFSTTSLPINHIGDTIALAVPAYRQILKDYDTNKPESISLAINEFKSRFRQKLLKSNDQAFMLFRKLYYDVLVKQNELLYADTSPSAYKAILKGANSGDSTATAPALEKDPETILFRKNGMDLFFSEGSPYFGEEAHFLKDSFAGFVTPQISDYLELREKELIKGFSEDASLLITFDQLSERVYNWEQYLKKYPKSPLLADAKHNYSLYLGVLLVGLDNSRVFHPFNSGMSDDVNAIKTYKQFIADHPKSDTAKLLKDYLGLIEQNEHQWNDTYKQFLKDHGATFTLGLQPPTR